MTAASPEILALGLMFVFGWNNGPVLVGNLAGSGILSYRTALVLTTAGLLVGTLAGGERMSASLVGSLTPPPADRSVIATLTISIFLMLILNVFKLPVSLSNVVVGAYLGASFSEGLPINGTYLSGIVIGWLLVPPLTAVATLAIYNLTKYVVQNWSLVTLDTFNRLAVMLTTFYVASALGANNVGMVASLLAQASTGFSQLLGFALVGVAMIGMFALGRGISGVIGEELVVLSPVAALTAMFAGASVVWLFTQFALPLSVTQAIIGGIVGVALTRDFRILNRRILSEMLLSWILVTAVGFFAGMLLTRAL